MHFFFFIKCDFERVPKNYKLFSNQFFTLHLFKFFRYIFKILENNQKKFIKI